MLTTILSLNLVWAWAYRGGSLYKQQSWGCLGKTRWLCLLAVPLFMVSAFALSMPAAVWTDWAVLALGFVTLFGAQADGWGRQMDLGKNDKPDNETGYQIRNLIFKSTSSFTRDLVGLYMRFAQFLIPAVCFYFVNPWFILPCVALATVTPMLWVLEDKMYYGKNNAPVFAFVEFLTGAMLCAATLLAVS
jgi:hypothetical protein|tara:strand:+ start:76 stop:645 length:570 start_codon:yes stop_codon:yes gene_type:complete